MTDLEPIDARAGLLARAESLSGSEPSFARFLRALVLATDPADLEGLNINLGEARFRRTFGQLGKRELAAFSVHVIAAETPGQPDIIEAFSADMPFLVDSVLAAIRAFGGQIRLLAHPVLHFDPATFRVLDTPIPGSRPESVLHVEIDPIADLGVRERLKAEIEQTLTDVGRAVAGWRPMLERVRRLIEDWRQVPPGAPAPLIAEAVQFLGWLAEHNFTFLGMRDYRVEGEGPAARLVPVTDSELGILEDPNLRFLRSGAQFVEMTPQHVAFLAEPAPVIVSKANIRSRVHRRSYMDYIGVKLFDAEGNTAGELRILGLFTSMSLTTPNSEVPLVRRKLAAVLKRAGHDPQGHAGKALMNVLDTYPRDELFQIDEAQLFAFSSTIAGLLDRPRVRVLPRVDRFGNFVSILVYVPRDRYDSQARIKIGAYLAERYAGRLSTWYPYFPEGDLVRLHVIIGRNGGPVPEPEVAELEADIAELVRSFADRLVAIAPSRQAVLDYLNAFPGAYQVRYPAETALSDIATIKGLSRAGAPALQLLENGAPGQYGLRILRRGGTVPLSKRVPMLENFGFSVIDEDSYEITPLGGGAVSLHDMQLAAAGLAPLGDRGLGQRIENAILAVWDGEAEDDPLNQLTTRAGLSWIDVELLRALLRYLKQVGIAYSRSYLMAVLVKLPEVARALVGLFHARLDPGFAGVRERAAASAREAVLASADATPSIDEDQILRRVLNLVEGAVRTNAYQRADDGSRRPALAIKFDCSKLDGLPAPRPFREIFVYSPRVEGLYLRFGPVARGGLRWSDRPEDFRTEVLGLVKAQQVKNAIIVPVGAKGAFVPRQLPTGDREAVLAEGTAAYKIFVSSLLDVTDNLEADTVVPPPDTLRQDADDPYLVVAADKGTASFSDTANAIAKGRGFWLGDAFASGGSVGYDHKKMGITARGGWEAVKRHFRELDRDIQASAFTAVGVGDMSGDVFGNGMLLSPQLRLVAAFDHRDIFIDPDPDPTVSLAERARLFQLPRSSWQDYNPALLSKGGGVYSRSLKTVALFAEARRLLGLGSEAVSPADVIRAILKAEVDLLWFGGIGTYVRASSETDAQAGDKANDAVRITGSDIRAKVVGEGANLAVTQLGRIEYALAGGRINTDAIDNSAGVNSSDLEVNIKIALGPLVRSGQLTEQVRNEFLPSMTDEVAALCLRNNYLQTLALSLDEARGVSALAEHRSLIAALEEDAGLVRSVEFLPDESGLAARAAEGRGLVRPELAVLLAYAKNAAKAALVTTSVPDDPYLGKELYRYFPPRLVETFGPSVDAHRLRREVIATVLANTMMNRGGAAFVNEMSLATRADIGAIAGAYAVARDVYGLVALNSEIDALDGQVPGATQLLLYGEVQALVRRETLWFLRNGNFDSGLAPLVTRYAAGIEEVRGLLGNLLGPYLEDEIAARARRYEAAGAGRGIARRFAELGALSFATDVVLVADRADASVADAAVALFGILDRFGLAAVLDAASALVLVDPFDRMALDRALANLMRAQRDLAADVLAAGTDAAIARLAAWEAARPDAVARAAEGVAQLTEGGLTVSRLSVAAGLLADLARET